MPEMNMTTTTPKGPDAVPALHRAQRQGSGIFTPSLFRAFIPSTATATREPFPTSFPKTCSIGAGDTRTPKERRVAEERRLFYVACTRAQRRLILLAKWNKKAEATHLFEELVRDPHDPPLPITVMELADVHSAAAAAVEPAAGATAREPRDDLQREAHGLARLPELREALDRVRAEARKLVAESLAAPQPEFEHAADAARDAAGRLAIAVAVERSEPAPDWIAQRESWRMTDASLRAVVAGEAPVLDAYPLSPALAPAEALLPPHPRLRNLPALLLRQARTETPRARGPRHSCSGTPPTSRSRTSTASGPPPTTPMSARTSRHRPAPASSDSCSSDARPTSPRPDAASKWISTALRRLEAQLRTVFAKLHSETLHIVETEQALEFDYPLGDHIHTFRSRIDRLDLLPTGGHRIVDYKTGEPHDFLVNPKPGDLQLGIYALALQSRDPLLPISGVAEYWLLSTGQRGSIDLEALKLDSVRKKINGVIEGLLAGEFPKGSKCRGHCNFLGA